MAYIYYKTGPNAKNGGWRMSTDIYAKCPKCGYYMSLDPEADDICTCGNMHKDSSYGRFGAKTGDKSIRLYKKFNLYKS